MKLLLTSSGIENQSLANTLQDLVGKAPSETAVGFVPTAANVEEGNKDWFVSQLLQLWRYGYNNIDIVDPSAAGVDWQTRLDQTDVVYLSGGNTFHLLDQMRQTGFDAWLQTNREQKVFVGSSAGSIVMTKSIGIAGVEPGDPNLPNLTDLTGLGWADCEVSPHTPNMVSYDSCQAYGNTILRPLYAMDDDTGLKIVDDAIHVISEGRWEVYPS